MRRIRTLITIPLLALLGALGVVSPAGACGGFFCQNSPVDQVAERIVFTVNDDDTITSLIEIAYQGEADDFSWILPIPEAIGADDLQVPDDGDLVFDELHALTDVQFIAPPVGRCAEILRMNAVAEDSAAPTSEGVEVFASGEVGPFGFDVIGSDSPTALTDWLSDNGYRVTDDMIPLIDLYVEEEFAFVAMRLLDGEDANSIAPIEITYPGTKPMIPIRLTAVAAFPQMPIYAWVLADAQAVPENYEHFEIDTAEITFFPFGGNDYASLVQARADAVGGRGFITEFAAPASTLNLQHPYLAQQTEAQPYITRLATYLDPEEMTVDPVFGFDDSRDDVSNVRDASNLRGLYDCERQETRTGDSGSATDAIDARVVNASLSEGTFAGYSDLPEGAKLVPIEEDFISLPLNGRKDESSNAFYLLALLVITPAVLGAGYFLGRRSPD